MVTSRGNVIEGTSELKTEWACHPFTLTSPMACMLI
jgi:hypothetical protein